MNFLKGYEEIKLYRSIDVKKIGIIDNCLYMVIFVGLLIFSFEGWGKVFKFYSY